jgi:ABC-type molybdate transport system substrate-binding protein
VYTGKIGTLNSTEPLNLSLALNGASLGQEISISNKSSATLQMRITSGSRLPVFLSAAVGNTTNPLRFSFSNASGYGNFTSAVTIADSSASSGVYFVTISAVTAGLTISQVVQIRSG